MKKLVLPALAGAAIVAVGLYTLRPAPAPTTAPPDQTSGRAMAEVRLPATLSSNAQLGKRAFDATCAACHGTNAAGKLGAGPPLVHRIYEPSHHGDTAFLMAARNGVRAHHWTFGDMPPQAGITQGDVQMIVTYIRELQRENGIE